MSNAVKGAGRCPKCGSRAVRRFTMPTTSFYAEQIEGCVNCKAMWEPFDPAQLLDAHQPTTSSFKEPCDNCAFRPGSPEQSDPARWAELIASLKANGQFYCHKGVPISPGNGHGFAYPTKLISKELHPTARTEDVKRLRMCRGWLKMWGRQMDKETTPIP